MLDQPRRVLVPQVVPPQVDAPERLLRLVGQALVVQARIPRRRVAVRLQHDGLPHAMEQPIGLAELVAEHARLERLRIAFDIAPQPRDHVTQARRRDRHEPRLAALGRLATQRDQPSFEIDVGEAQRQHLAGAHARVDGRDDERLDVHRRLREQGRFLLLVDAAPANVVFLELLDQRLRAALERRARDVLAPDGPVQHVPQQVDDAVHRAGGEHADAAAMDGARLPEVGDEVLHVGRADVDQRAVAEPIDERLHRPGVVLPHRQALRDHVLFAVDLRELAKRHGAGLRRREAARVKRACAHRHAHLVEHGAGLGLRPDLAIGPLGQAHAHAAEAAPPRVLAAIAVAALVLAQLVQTHDVPLVLPTHRRARRGRRDSATRDA
ncbi:MAG TPA: hypothetical protein VMF13_04885 [Luteitalea sp.]|nr:hypothetical protein [Luteitalea sp.]